MAGRLQANSTCRPQLFHLVFIEWIRSVWTVSFPFSLELYAASFFFKSWSSPISKDSPSFRSRKYRLKPFQQVLRVDGRSLALVLLILDNTSFLPYRSLYKASRRRTALSSFDRVSSNLLALELFNFIVF